MTICLPVINPGAILQKVDNWQRNLVNKNHLTPVRMFIIKKTKGNKCFNKDMEKLDPCSLLVETPNSVTAIQKSMKIPQKIKGKTIIGSSSLTSKYLLERIEIRLSKSC